MLDLARAQVDALPAEALVLDVGGWAAPLERADWVLDLQPYATRGLYGETDPSRERFDASRWVQRDICDREPWPFADGQFDVAVCSHTLEDVRDPVWVCSELSRVARAGYVETPSRLEEQAYGIQGPWVGWGHHHWLVSLAADGALEFLFKHHVLHGDPLARFPAGWGAQLATEERVVSHWWRGELRARERLHFTPEALDADLRGLVAEAMAARPREPRRRRPGR